MLHKNVAPGVHRLDHAFTNAYLIEDEGRLTLVDTLFPRSWDLFTKAVRELGRKLDDVEAVVITHGHFDHMGFAKRAKEELGLPLLAHPEELDVMSHPWHYEHEHSRLRHAPNPLHVGILTKMTVAGAAWVKGTRDAKTFATGDVLDVPGRPKVIFTPGHTHGHCSLSLPDRDALIAGDAIVALCPYRGRRGAYIVSGAATADSNENLASLGDLAATGAKTVLTGHGEPWTKGIESMVAEARANGPG